MASQFEMLHLPWDDVIYKYMFPLLDLISLFRLRQMNSEWLKCVTSYFEQSKFLHIVNSRKFTEAQFYIMTCDSYNLRSVRLRQCNDWLNDSVLLPCIVNNNNLERIDISGSTCLSGKSITSVSSCCPNLKELSLRDCHWLSDADLNSVSMKCLALERLDITGCWDITDSSIKNIATLCLRYAYL